MTKTFSLLLCVAAFPALADNTTQTTQSQFNQPIPTPRLYVALPDPVGTTQTLPNQKSMPPLMGDGCDYTDAAPGV